MGKNRGQVDEPCFIVDRGRLHGCNLVAAERLAHDIEAAREWSITKRPVTLPRKRRTDGGDQRLFRIRELGLRPGKRSSDGADRLTGPLHGHPPRRTVRSSLPRIATVLPSAHGRSLPWHPPASRP